MKHSVIFLGIFFLGILEIFSQSDYREGYIIKNNHDTIYGLLDYRGNIGNSKKCSFKINTNSEKQEFLPNDLLAYRFIDGKYYISKLVKNGDLEEHLFLEYLINGIVSIYYYRDYSGEHYLIDKGDSKLYELKNEEKEVYVNDIRYFKASKEYIGMLKFAFKESPSISQKVDNISLNHKSLVNITREYHNEICVDEECIIYEKQLPKRKSKFGPVIGLSLFSMHEVYDLQGDWVNLHNAQFGDKIIPSIGLFYKVNMPYINEKFFFQYVGTYSHLKLSSSVSYEEPIYHMNIIDVVAYSHHAFNNSFAFKYAFLKGGFRPTLHAGGFVNYFFLSDFYQSGEVTFSWGESYYKNETTESPFSKLDYGLIAGLGFTGIVFKEKEFFVDLKYQKGFGMLYGWNTETYSLNIGLSIGK